ncbi:MAG: hypothetical protein Q9174_001501 [Haloplaca sp. 1 TL-2023]
MLFSLPFLVFCLSNFFAPTAAQVNSSLPQKGFPIKLPDGYTIERTPGEGELDPIYTFGAIFNAMLELAYEDSRNLTDPISHNYPTITLNITGYDDGQFFRQFASYTLYHALQTMIADNDYRVSNFTLQNDPGTIACKVIIAPPSADWQRLVGGFTGGISPRDANGFQPAILEARQYYNRGNESEDLETLTPFYASDWYGPVSTPEDIFLALTTMLVSVSDYPDKDQTINYQRIEQYGYHLNVTNVPLPDQEDYLTNRGVLNLCAKAYQEVSEQLGYFRDVSNFETVLVWANGTEMVGQHVLRYEGSKV